MEVIKVLQNKQNGVLLFDSVIGKNVSFERIVDDDIICSSDGQEFSYRRNGKMFDNKDAIVVLTPSRNMRDWSKFAWKKGDVLRFSDILVIFEKWAKDDYTEFKAAYEFNIGSKSFSKGNDYYTAEFCKAIDETANNFVKKIEEHYCGKLNLETLEIEKPKTKVIKDFPKRCEFKPFDKVLVRDTPDDSWMPAFFAEYSDDGYGDILYGICGGNTCVYYEYCIPYNEETEHLLGTTDEWKGGEG